MISDSDQTVVMSIAGVLENRIHEWYGEGAIMDSKSVTLRKHPYSFFIRFPVKASVGEQALLVKIHRKPHIPTLGDALAADHLRELARNEYEMSQRIWRAFEAENAPDCEAVHYLDYLEEWNALLMWEVKGKMLKQYLLHPLLAVQSQKAMKQLLSFLSAASHWLRIFHCHVSGLQAIPFPAVEARQRMKEVLSKLELNSDGQVEVAPYHQALEQCLDSLRVLTVSSGLLHSDFHFSNILITVEGRACVLDYSLNYRGPIYFDLATLLIDPQTRKAQILSGGRFLTFPFLQRCRQSLLDSYFRSEPYHENVLKFYCALAILNKWSADEADFSVRPGVVNRTLARMTRRYYADLIPQYL